MRKISEISDQEKIEMIAEIDGVVWLYNPDALTPHRFFVYKSASISHRSSFLEWDGKTEIPIGKDFCFYREYLTEYSAILLVIQSWVKETNVHGASVLSEEKMSSFISALYSMHESPDGLDLTDAFGGAPNLIYLISFCLGFNSTPRQLCDALLIASGKAKL